MRFTRGSALPVSQETELTDGWVFIQLVFIVCARHSAGWALGTAVVGGADPLGQRQALLTCYLITILRNAPEVRNSVP